MKDAEVPNSQWVKKLVEWDGAIPLQVPLLELPLTTSTHSTLRLRGVRELPTTHTGRLQDHRGHHSKELLFGKLLSLYPPDTADFINLHKAKSTVELASLLQDWLDTIAYYHESRPVDHPTTMRGNSLEARTKEDPRNKDSSPDFMTTTGINLVGIEHTTTEATDCLTTPMRDMLQPVTTAASWAIKARLPQASQTGSV